jgi:hypothetical protein
VSRTTGALLPAPTATELAAIRARVDGRALPGGSTARKRSATSVAVLCIVAVSVVLFASWIAVAVTGNRAMIGAGALAAAVWLAQAAFAPPPRPSGVLS